MKRSILLSAIIVMSLVGTGVVLGQDATTNATDTTPTVESTTVPDPLTPKVSNTITATINDSNGLDNISTVEIVLYRSDGASGDADSLRDHYTITYDNADGSVSVSPSPGSDDNVSVSVNSGLDNTTTEDQLSIEFTPEEIAAPSVNTGDSTVDGYTWEMEVTATDTSGQVGTGTDTTEMTTRISLKTKDTSISATGDPGSTVQYSPNMRFRNDGNVELDVDYAATEQTHDGGTGDTIPASAMSFNDVDDVSTASSYSTTSQTYEADIAYDTTQTMYNWVDIPQGLNEGSYSGTMTYTATESAAS